jgi:hypothetical protein
MFWLATWLYRNEDWPQNTKATDVSAKLLRDFFITEEERDQLFQTVVPEQPNSFLTESTFQDYVLLREFEPAPDAYPQAGGTLRELQLRNVGPANRLDFAPAERVSIVTGDNGLGKTFILECCWRCLTGNWATKKEALPHDSSRPASISFVISKRDDFPSRTTLQFDRSKQRWPKSERVHAIPGLIVYARVDGSFAVWDPAQNEEAGDGFPSVLLFSRDEVLDGLGKKIEGLIRDWVKWQNARDQSLFRTFARVLEGLSPPDMAPLTPGEPTRLDDPRDIPTLKHAYGVVPFTNESAGFRRIASVAYLLVWAWSEHRIYSERKGTEPQESMVIMIDELEAHLHPKWQRAILPALLGVTSLLSEKIKPQVIVATHSPLILASMESTFSDDTDKLFHLHLKPAPRTGNTEVILEEEPYWKRGTVDAWLTSDVFELKQPRSREGESALEAAKRLLAQSSSDQEEIAQTHEDLRNTLPAEDTFWPLWLHFVESKGVKA